MIPNPNHIINSMLQNNPALKNNPIMQNALTMAQKNDVRGLQELAQNVAQAKGADINKLTQEVRQKLGM